MKINNRFDLKHIALPFMASLLLAPFTASCLNDDDDDTDYTQWRNDNEAYVEKMAALKDASGQPEYQRISPVWAPGIFILMKYHTRPEGYATMLRPLSNSTVDVKYRGMLMDSTVFDSSYASTTYGDSIYRCRPNTLVPGFWTALTEMVPGDSVTVIIPAQAGYGATTSGTIKPFSTLIFDIKMKKIVSYETPS